MDMCKVVAWDYKEECQVVFGPYEKLEIIDNIWAINSGRKFELASKAADGFWYLKDGKVKAKSKNIRVSAEQKIKAASHD